MAFGQKPVVEGAEGQYLCVAVMKHQATTAGNLRGGEAFGAGSTKYSAFKLLNNSMIHIKFQGDIILIFMTREELT